MNLFINCFVLIVGGLLALQGVINGRLASYLNHPIQAALLSFFVGTFALTIFALALRAPLPHWDSMKSIPWYLLVGGLFGAIMVTSAIVLIPKIGAAPFIGGIIVGQLIMALSLDHFGALGLTTRPLNWQRIVGAALLVLGFIMTRK